MGSQDGIDVLLAAVHYLIEEAGRRDIQFLLVGDGPEFASLQRQAAELGISDWVIFAGYLSGEPLLDAFHSMDIGVAPDLANPYNDKCTMNKVLEYMAFGIPLVQFDLTESRYSAGEAALYAKHNDPADFACLIMRLLDDPDLRRRMGQLGQERIASRFSWSHESPHLLAAYRRVFSGAA